MEFNVEAFRQVSGPSNRDKPGLIEPPFQFSDHQAGPLEDRVYFVPLCGKFVLPYRHNRPNCKTLQVVNLQVRYVTSFKIDEVNSK